MMYLELTRVFFMCVWVCVRAQVQIQMGKMLLKCGWLWLENSPTPPALNPEC